jgi:hypothetical protein
MYGRLIPCRHGDDDHQALIGGDIAGQRVDGRAHRLRGRVGDELIEARNVLPAQAPDLAAVIDTDDQRPPTALEKAVKLRGQGIDVGDVDLELLAAVLAAGEGLDQMLLIHDIQLFNDEARCPAVSMRISVGGDSKKVARHG